MSTERYTERQVLFGLREVWQDFTGVNDPFDSDTRIDLFMKADGSWDELDFADIFRGIEGFFEFGSSNEEWGNFFGFDVAKRSLDEWDRTVAPNLTFGSLSRFIADRAPVVASFRPVSVFGRKCVPAGIFAGIQRVAEKATGKNRRFPPSARIRDVMRGRDLDNFWTQLRWMTEHSTPELPVFWRAVAEVTGCLGVLAMIGAFATTWVTSNSVWIIPTLIAAVASFLIATAYKRFTNPLPTDIVTFRDLSVLIANDGSFVTTD